MAQVHGRKTNTKLYIGVQRDVRVNCELSADAAKNAEDFGSDITGSLQFKQCIHAFSAAVYSAAAQQLSESLLLRDIF
jgi:hypothetical protein